MGEHAAVYGHPALVAAIGARLEVQLEASPDGTVEIHIPQWENFRTTHRWDEIRALGKRSTEAWAKWNAEPGVENLRALQGDSPDHLILVALAEAAKTAAISELPGLRMCLSSHIPTGSGFGSSAALSTAVVGGFFSFVEHPHHLDDIYRCALNVERRQHGAPSGVDSATVTYGGILWTQRENGELTWSSLETNPPWLKRLRIYHSGAPKESTGALVTAVKKIVHQPEVSQALEDIDGYCGQLAEYIQGEEPLTAFERDQIRQLIQDCENRLERLGVVPEPIQTWIRAIEKAGGAAKISGAGALTGNAAGAILVWPQEDESLSTPELPWRLEDFSLGGEGYRVEERR